MQRWIRTQQEDVPPPPPPMQRPHAEPEDVTVTSGRLDLENVVRDVVESIRQHFDDPQVVENLVNKLTGYRLVDRVCDLRRGRFVRCLRLHSKTPSALNRGGTLVNVTFTDEGTVALCNMTRGKFLSFRFDQCLTFEKMTDQEQMMMAALAAPPSDDDDDA